MKEPLQGHSQLLKRQFPKWNPELYFSSSNPVSAKTEVTNEIIHAVTEAKSKMHTLTQYEPYDSTFLHIERPLYIWGSNGFACGHKACIFFAKSLQTKTCGSHGFVS